MTRFAFLLVAILCVVPLVAFEWPLDRRALEEAISIGQARIDMIRMRFHAGYRFETSGSAPVDYIEIITPYRSVVLSAEQRARIGDRMFGLKEAQEVAAKTAAELLISVALTFHPHNTLIFVPEYRVQLAPPRGRLAEAHAARAIDRFPRYGPRLDGYPLPTPPTAPGAVLPGGSEPLTGGVLVAHFDATGLDPKGIYEVVVADQQDRNVKELARVRVDFARLR
jgi:hypothetical protein